MCLLGCVLLATGDCTSSVQTHADLAGSRHCICLWSVPASLHRLTLSTAQHLLLSVLYHVLLSAGHRNPVLTTPLLPTDCAFNDVAMAAVPAKLCKSGR